MVYVRKLKLLSTFNYKNNAEFHDFFSMHILLNFMYQILVLFINIEMIESKFFKKKLKYVHENLKYLKKK